MIKVFFCCSWDPDPQHFLDEKYKDLTPNSCGKWKNISAVTNIKDADWIVIIDDIHKNQLSQILSFDKNKVICIPREPHRRHPIYLKYNFKYSFTYNNFYHCWSSIKAIKKNYMELNNYKKYYNKSKICSAVISKNQSDNGIYYKRIHFLKKLSQQEQFINKVDIFGYNWSKKELGDMYKGTLGGGMGRSSKSNQSILLKNTTKWDGLESYKYSIAIENSCLENYFSEKFTDCILAWTIPIYYGCPNIDKYFSNDCYYWLDINSSNCFIELEKILNTPITEKQIRAIEKARDLILNKHNVWNVVNDIIENDG